MDLGVAMPEAVRNGLKFYLDSHEVINDVAVNVRDNFVPPNFGDITSAVIADFAADAELDAEDLTLYSSHEGSDFWLVVYKGNLMSVSAEGFNGRFHISELQKAALTKHTREGVNEEIRNRPGERARSRNYLSRKDGGNG